MLAQLAPAQSAKRKTPPKGPRAMGLVELSPNGKALLVPITILLDGEFYDASAYKASPVPMALESGTVYEGMQAGVSQGLFTISSASQGNNTWIGNGSWQSASALAAAAAASAKKKETRDKPAPEPVSGPPVLRRAGRKNPRLRNLRPTPHLPSHRLHLQRAPDLLPLHLLLLRLLQLRMPQLLLLREPCPQPPQTRKIQTARY